MISDTTIIKTEFDLEVRKRTKTGYVGASACQHAMLGKITTQAQGTDRHGYVNLHCLLNRARANDQVRAREVNKPTRKALADR